MSDSLELHKSIGSGVNCIKCILIFEVWSVNSIASFFFIYIYFGQKKEYKMLFTEISCKYVSFSVYVVCMTIRNSNGCCHSQNFQVILTTLCEQLFVCKILSRLDSTLPHDNDLVMAWRSKFSIVTSLYFLGLLSLKDRQCCTSFCYIIVIFDVVLFDYHFFHAYRSHLGILVPRLILVLYY